MQKGAMVAQSSGGVTFFMATFLGFFLGRLRSPDDDMAPPFFFSQMFCRASFLCVCCFSCIWGWVSHQQAIVPVMKFHVQLSFHVKVCFHHVCGCVLAARSVFLMVSPSPISPTRLNCKQIQGPLSGRWAICTLPHTLDEFVYCAVCNLKRAPHIQKATPFGGLGHHQQHLFQILLRIDSGIVSCGASLHLPAPMPQSGMLAHCFQDCLKKVESSTQSSLKSHILCRIALVRRIPQERAIPQQRPIPLVRPIPQERPIPRARPIPQERPIPLVRPMPLARKGLRGGW